MPFKHNSFRRHQIGNVKFKVTKWFEYEAVLRQRGSLIMNRPVLAARTNSQPGFILSALNQLTLLPLTFVFRRDHVIFHNLSAQQPSILQLLDVGQITQRLHSERREKLLPGDIAASSG